MTETNYKSKKFLGMVVIIKLTYEVPFPIFFKIVKISVFFSLTKSYLLTAE